ncbi:hypothetical protein DIPPA_14441 [Diplonema papillatum]|nr:hypothetical protein DIPPA_14441 [Diplonema papillatum]
MAPRTSPSLRRLVAAVAAAAAGIAVFWRPDRAPGAEATTRSGVARGSNAAIARVSDALARELEEAPARSRRRPLNNFTMVRF